MPLQSFLAPGLVYHFYDDLASPCWCIVLAVLVHVPNQPQLMHALRTLAICCSAGRGL